jgi:hypothetical protein
VPYALSGRRNTWYAEHPEQSAKRAARQRKDRAAKRAFLAKLKDRPCKDCGNRFPHYVMDFDHRDPFSKRFMMSKVSDDNASWDNIKAEALKCDVVCSNCHRIRTWGQQRAAEIPCKDLD